MSVSIVSGVTSDLATIDPVSKALRVTHYDTAGNSLAPKPTYRASTAVVFVAVAGTAPFFAIYGSATKTVRIKRIVISGFTLTAVGYINTNVAKYSTAPTGGTATALTPVPLDSNDAASTISLCSVYTAAPTAGTKVGDLSSRRSLGQATTAAAAGIPEEIEFKIDPDEGIVLRGTTQGVCLYFSTAPATAVTLAITVEYTEE